MHSNFLKKKGDKERMAMALQKEAFSLLGKTKKIKSNRKKAREKLEQSLLLIASTNNRHLRIENLEKLKWLAEVNNQKGKAANYAKQINEINRLIQTSSARDILASKVENLNFQKTILNEELKSLSEAQLEDQLIIMLQKNQMDSLQFEMELDSLILAQNDMLFAEQAAKLKLQRSETKLQQSQRNLFLAIAGIIALLLIGVFIRYLETKKLNIVLATKNEIIEAERKKSDELLLNILPAVVATELKTYGTAKARKYQNATVFFSDFKKILAASPKH